MSILIVGLSHKTAPVEIREQLAFNDESLPSALATLVDRENIEEALIVSTCNRVEMITSTSGTADSALAHAQRFICRYHGLPQTSIDRYLYHHADESAVKHLFRVAASLDSMVMGEPQILGQVKDAYARAVEVGTIGSRLNKLMHRTFAVAKRVRTETGIAANAVSIGYVAVELAKKVFDDLRGKTVMMVGAGEMAELALRNLRSNGAERILVANRTLERAQALAEEFAGQAIPIADLYRHLTEVDIVIASTGATDFVINAERLKPTIDTRRHRPLFLIDIGVPRNIDPEVSKLDGVFAFDIDDLEAAMQANRREREREAVRAESIIDSEVAQCLVVLRSLDIGPAIGALKQQFDQIAHIEFERNRRRLGNLTPEQEIAIKNMLTSLTNKFSHPIISHLRQAASDGTGEEVAEFCRKAYRLDDSEDKS